jgi:hypothetical protein
MGIHWVLTTWVGTIVQDEPFIDFGLHDDFTAPLPDASTVSFPRFRPHRLLQELELLLRGSLLEQVFDCYVGLVDQSPHSLIAGVVIALVLEDRLETT